MGEYIDLDKNEEAPFNNIKSDPPFDGECDEEDLFGGGGSEDSVSEAADPEHVNPSEEWDDSETVEGIPQDYDTILCHIEEVVDNLLELRSKLIWARPKDQDILWGQYGPAIERCRGHLASVRGK